MIENLDKVAIELDTSRDIVKRADEITSSLLNTYGFAEQNRNNVSWKICQFKENKYRMVSQSKNWEEI